MSLEPWLLVVDVVVDPAVEEPWNEWYDTVHLPEIAACPGFREAARYVAEADDGRHYLTLYELTGPEAIATAEFAGRRGWAHFANDVTAAVRLYRRMSSLAPER